MNVRQAAKILEDHQDGNENSKPINEACRMGAEALKNPLLAFIKEEVPFRLDEMLGVPEEEQTPELVAEIVSRLYDENDVMFDYAALDDFIIEILDENGVSHS